MASIYLNIGVIVVTQHRVHDPNFFGGGSDS